MKSVGFLCWLTFHCPIEGQKIRCEGNWGKFKRYLGTRCRNGAWRKLALSVPKFRILLPALRIQDDVLSKILKLPTCGAVRQVTIPNPTTAL
jgi:hypothetical protein